MGTRAIRADMAMIERLWIVCTASLVCAWLVSQDGCTKAYNPDPLRRQNLTPMWQLASPTRDSLSCRLFFCRLRLPSLCHNCGSAGGGAACLSFVEVIALKVKMFN